ncbi:MAG TPA: TrkH family potassium uptake protein [Thermodesulfobacteriota bacterium]
MPVPRAIRRVLRRISPAQLVLGSFAAAIAIGTALLMLPAMAAPGTPPVGFVDALFTATSAVCVTGLASVDTATRWSGLGQATILLLIQLGGLGIMTCSTFLVLLVRGRISVRGRMTLQDTLGGASAADLRRLVATVFVSTFVIEAIGAAALAARFALEMPPGRAIWFGLFHAVSAFCNAGFALFSRGLVDYVDDPTVNVVVPGLVILGGLGFLVIGECWARRRGKAAQRELSLHTRLVLSTTALLLGAGMVGFFLLERANTLAALPWPAKVMAAWFQAVTPRTAGYNTLDYADLTNPTLLFTIVLMFIGAAPGSTGGGVKVTTAAILWGIVRSQLAGEERVHLFRHAVPRETVGRAVTLAAAAALAVVVATLALQVTEAHGQVSDASRGLFLELLFEAVSAFGTVGLSTGVTPRLSDAGKIVIVAMMYLGRVGPLTLTLGLSRPTRGRIQYPEEPVVVG